MIYEHAVLILHAVITLQAVLIMHTVLGQHSVLILHIVTILHAVHSFFYKKVIFWVQAQNFLKNPSFRLKKLLVLNLFPGSKLS